MRRMVEGYGHRRGEVLPRTEGVSASYPSTTVPVVPLPIFDGEDI